MNKVHFLSLGRQPIANRFVKNKNDKEFFFNLDVVFDNETKLVSLAEFVDLPTMFNKEYVYLSSASQTMRTHFKNNAILFKEQFHPSRVLEIGSNDGVFLKNFKTEEAVAVEPCSNFSKITNKLGYKTYDQFWDTSLATQIKKADGSFDLIFSANCMCHIPDIEGAFLAIEKVLNSDGVFVFEDPSLLEMISRNSYDQIYDEHAHIFSVTSLDNILKKCNLEIFKIDHLDVHGGSNRVYVKKKDSNRKIEPSVSTAINKESKFGISDIKTYTDFGESVKKSKKELVDILKELKSKGKKIVSYGATSKSTTIFNYCGIDDTLIDYIVDTTPAKQGKFSPGVNIPVVSDKEGFDSSVDVAFLGAWNFKDEIIKKEKSFLQRGGVFITHVPSVGLIIGE